MADAPAEVELGGTAPDAAPKIGLKAEGRGLTVSLEGSVEVVAEEEEEGGFTTLARLNVEGCNVADDSAGWGKT